MNKKAFFFGIGVGLLAACLVLFFAYGAQKRKWQAEIDSIVKATAAPSENVAAAPTIEPKEPTAAPTSKPTAAPTEEPTNAPTDAPTEPPDDETTTAEFDEPEEVEDEPTEKPTSEPTEEPTPKPPVSSDGTVMVTLPQNADATTIARILRDEEIIDSVGDFVTFLAENEATRKMNYGTFKLKKGMPFEEIFDAIGID